MTESLRIFTGLILPILLMMATGFVADRRLHLDLRTLNRACLYAFVPCLAFDKVYESRVPLRMLGVSLGFTVLMVLSLLAAGLLLARATGASRSMCAAFSVVAGMYNSGNYGLPLIEITFHNNPYPTALQTMVVAAQNILTFTLGLALLSGGKRSWRESVRSMAQYPFMYFLAAAILCRSFGWTVPVPLLTSLRYLGDALVPVALLTLGIQVSRIRLQQGLGRVAAAAALRLVGGPVLAYTWIRVLGLHGLLAETLFIGSGVPTAVNVTILSLEYDNEPEFAAQVTLLTTVLSGVTVTVLVYLAFRLGF